MTEFVHDSSCTIPMTEHKGDEPCIRQVEAKEIDHAPAHYAQGPQGNQVADYRADFLARYGSGDSTRTLGNQGISDRRDNRDPEQVGREILAAHNGNGGSHG